MKGLVVTALAVLAVTGLGARSGFTWEELNSIDQKWPAAKVSTTGLRYVVLQEGRGETPRSGDLVKVLYKGTFFDGRVFDQAQDPLRPFAFRLGRGEIIEGWEEGIAAMRPGEKRILIVPYDLAYGSRGRPPSIPRQTSLIFEVELLSIHPNPTGSAAKP